MRPLAWNQLFERRVEPSTASRCGLRNPSSFASRCRARGCEAVVPCGSCAVTATRPGSREASAPVWALGPARASAPTPGRTCRRSVVQDGQGARGGGAANLEDFYGQLAGGCRPQRPLGAAVCRDGGRVARPQGYRQRQGRHDHLPDPRVHHHHGQQRPGHVHAVPGARRAVAVRRCRTIAAARCHGSSLRCTIRLHRFARLPACPHPLPSPPCPAAP